MITVPIEVPVPLQDLADVLTTCAEGGSTYWLDIGEDTRNIHVSWGNDGSVMCLQFFINYTGAGWVSHAITPKDLERGLLLALTDTTKLNAPMRSALSALVCAGELGAADADQADAVLQLTCFGEIVYG